MQIVVGIMFEVLIVFVNPYTVSIAGNCLLIRIVQILNAALLIIMYMLEFIHFIGKPQNNFLPMTCRKMMLITYYP